MTRDPVMRSAANGRQNGFTEDELSDSAASSEFSTTQVGNSINGSLPQSKAYMCKVMQKSMTYVGAGMICSHLVNLSLFFGVVVSWGIMWPLIRVLKGSWFSESLPESSMKSLNGYKVFE
ncbi:unnamed protein product [Trifolium pratense]|uniref:Uncharacterized protein n=1 Tax=Trifolium pratense TaxID=57577 RepID=A0ACB0LMC5_TRIPR|nr:unnamed protein product [Trifolium pratense]